MSDTERSGTTGREVSGDLEGSGQTGSMEWQVTEHSVKNSSCREVVTGGEGGAAEGIKDRTGVRGRRGGGR